MSTDMPKEEILKRYNVLLEAYRNLREELKLIR